MKLTNSYKLVSFKVVVIMTCKGYHTVTTKLTNLRYLKKDELKALDCHLWQRVLFLHFNPEVLLRNCVTIFCWENRYTY
ncbi:hypothetical protein [Priestia aryabhattai]|uniref:hypothetical protein n=1 Tax=Priestia aryabhattai TaxID=412384 RepID=UPI0021ADA5A5|nr:hypothetical protein [Priestia aryabhattai]